MKTLPAFLLPALLLCAGNLRAADQKNLSGQKKVIQLTFDADAKRDGVFLIAAKITDDPWNVRLGTRVRLVTTIAGLTPEKMKGRQLAFQIIKSDKNKRVQRKIIWITPTADELKKGRFDIAAEFTFDEPGSWDVLSGLVDPVKYEWWNCTASLCKVK